MCGLNGGSSAKLYPQATPQSNIPSGIIVMWSGVAAAIPSGWWLCDGNNGTPDLRNRFIVGAGSSYGVGNTGGSDTVTLSSNQMPSHNHGFSLTASSAGSHTHSNTFSVRLSNLTCSSAGAHTHTISGSGSLSGSISSGGDHTHSVSGSISNAGGGQAHENRPPYYALCFIMKA